MITLVGVTVLAGCSQNEPKHVEETLVSVTREVESPDVVPTKLLTMELGGMSCEMGCGSAIRKELFTTGAVERVKFDFKMGRDLNIAEISYDESKISEKEIIAIVSEMNEKQFNVENSSVSNYKKPADKSESVSGPKHNKTNIATDKPYREVEPSESFRIKAPNLIDLLISSFLKR